MKIFPSARLRVGLVVAALALAATAQAQQALAYPSRPVKIVVPYAAGGTTDQMARLIASEMTKTLGQPVVVENRAGAAGVIGADAVAKSAPDGHTVCFCPTGPTILMPLLEPHIPYQVVRDLPPVMFSHRFGLAIMLGPRLPASIKTLADLIAHAQANPGKLSYASVGTGSPNHLAGELFTSMAGIQLIHVPYKGESQGMTDLLGGQVDVLIASVLIGEQQLKSGKLRMLAVTDPARIERFPDVPAVAETLPGYSASAHVGLHVPTGTPKLAVDKLASALATAIAQPTVREKMVAQGITPMGQGSEAYAQYLRTETDKWRQLIQQKQIKLN